MTKSPFMILSSRRFKSKHIIILSLFCIVLVAAYIRFSHFPTLFFTGDEGRDLLIASHMIKYKEFPLFGPLGHYQITSPPLYYYLFTAAYMIAGENALNTYIIINIFLLACIPMFFFLTRDYTNNSLLSLGITLVFSTAAIITHAHIIHISQAVFSLPFFLFSLFTMNTYIKTKKLLAFYCSVFSTLLLLQVYPPNIVAVIPILLTLLITHTTRHIILKKVIFTVVFVVLLFSPTLLFEYSSRFWNLTQLSTLVYNLPGQKNFLISFIDVIFLFAKYLGFWDYSRIPYIVTLIAPSLVGTCLGLLRAAPHKKPMTAVVLVIYLLYFTVYAALQTPGLHSLFFLLPYTVFFLSFLSALDYVSLYIKSHFLRTGFVILSVFILCTSVYSSYAYDPKYPGGDYYKAAFIAQQIIQSAYTNNFWVETMKNGDFGDRLSNPYWYFIEISTKKKIVSINFNGEAVVPTTEPDEIFLVCDPNPPGSIEIPPIITQCLAGYSSRMTWFNLHVRSSRVFPQYNVALIELTKYQ